MTSDIRKTLNKPPLASEYEDDRHFITAIARGLDVLACFRSGNKVLGNQEIAQRCKLPKSTVSRITYTLTRLGYLTQNEDSSKYQLGMATLSLGVGLLAKLDIRQVARPLMQALAEETQGMVTLGTRDRLSMLYLENCRSRSALTLSMDVGARIPIVSTAMGRAYLAEIPQQEREEIFGRVRELDELASDALMSGITASLADYERLGCTCSFGDWQKDVNAIAVGLNLGRQFPIMAISCGGPSFNLSEQYLLEEARPKLLEVVGKLKETVGQPA